MYGKLTFVIISPFFAIFKNVVHSLELSETSSYSASHQTPNYAQHFKTVAVRLRFGCGYIFNLLMFSTVFKPEEI